MRSSHDWFWFCFSLAEEVERDFANQSQSVTFDTQLKTALNDDIYSSQYFVPDVYPLKTRLKHDETCRGDSLDQCSWPC